MLVETVLPKHYAEVLNVWENSVRATHDFITDADIECFKPMIINQALPSVTLRCIKNDTGKILGFVGVAQHKIEMLFILNEMRHRGLGRCLTQYAIEQLKATKVDVNEQNPQAVGFYQSMGFVARERSELDDMGNPFPILHMSL